MLDSGKVKLIKRNWQLYLLLLVPVAWFLVFKYWPIYGSTIAFKDFRPGDTITSARWVGFSNFVKFFNHYYFWQLIRNTLAITLYQLAVSFPVAIVFALALNASYRTGIKKTVQYVTYMPYFISTVVMVGIMMQLLNSRMGIINNIIAALGGSRTDFMGQPQMFTSVYVLSAVWQYTGWNSIIYLAALSGISQELHEAAMIDGASRLGRIIHVDLPGIMPTIVVLFIMNCGQLMTVGFEKIFLMQNNLNLANSQVISTYVYNVGLKSLPPEFSYGSAIDLFNSLINLILVVVMNKFAQKASGTSLW